MRKIIQATVFIMFLAALLYGTDLFLLRGLRSAKSPPFGVLNKIVKGHINSDILIIGSSRAVVHYDCDVIHSVTNRSCFNIGMDGTQMDSYLTLLKIYLSHNRAPAFLLVNLDLSSLGVSKRIYAPYQYVPYLGEKFIDEWMLRKDFAVWKHKYLPLYSFSIYGMILTKPALSALFGFGSSDLGRCTNGFLGYNNSWDGTFDEFKKKNPRGWTFFISNENIENLRLILGECKQKGISAILVYSPSYCEVNELTLNKQEIFCIYRNISKEFGVPFLDYSGIEICKNKAYFYNSQHLNKQGAEKFSETLASDLMSKISLITRAPDGS